MAAKVSLSKIQDFRASVDKVVSMLTERGMVVTQAGANAFVSYDPETGAPIKVNIPMLRDDADEAFIAALRGFIDHECAHVLFTDSPLMAKTMKGQPKAVMQTFNVIEDVRIERAIQQRFPGSAQHIRETWEWIYDTKMNKLVAEAKTPEQLYGTLLPTLIHAWSGKQPANDYLTRQKLWDRLQPLMDRLAAIKPLVEAEIPDTQAALDIGRLLYEVTKSPPAPPPVPKPPKPATPPPPAPPPASEEPCEDGDPGEESKEEPGEDGIGDDSEESSEGECESDTNDEPGTSDEALPEDAELESDETPEGEDEALEDEGAEEAASDEASSEDESEKEAEGEDEAVEEEVESGDAEELEESEDGTSGGAGDEEDDQDSEAAEAETVVIDPLNSGEMLEAIEDFENILASAIEDEMSGGTREYTPYTLDHDDWVTPDPEHGTPTTEAARNLAVIEKTIERMVGQMASQFRRLFAQKELSVMVGGLRSGRLHAPALHRLHINDDRVFCRREEHNAQDTAVTLLIDCSGSMNGDNKIQLAITSAYAFSQTLERCGIRHEVLGFTTRSEGWYGIAGYEEGLRKYRAITGGMPSRYEPIRMIIFKAFDERLQKVRLRFGAMYGNKRPYACWQNVDGESLVYAANRLIQQREARKVLIVFSDGMPSAEGSAAQLAKHLKTTVEKLEKGRIETLGIGIMSEDVKRFYRSSIVINTAEELPSIVMNELKRLLLK